MEQRKGAWRECETLPRNIVWAMRAALLIMLAGIILVIVGVPHSKASPPVPLTAQQQGHRTGSQYDPNMSNGPGRYEYQTDYAWIWCHNALIYSVNVANNGFSGETGIHPHPGWPKNHYPHTRYSRAWMSGCIKAVDPQLQNYETTGM